MLHFNREVVTNTLDAVAFLMVTVDLYGRENFERLNMQLQQIKPELDLISFWKAEVRLLFRLNVKVKRWQAVLFYVLIAVGGVLSLHMLSIFANRVNEMQANNAYVASQDEYLRSAAIDDKLEEQVHRDKVAGDKVRLVADERAFERADARFGNDVDKYLDFEYVPSDYWNEAAVAIFSIILLILIIQFGRLIMFVGWALLRMGTYCALVVTRAYRIDGSLVLAGSAIFISSRIYSVVAAALGSP